VKGRSLGIEGYPSGRWLEETKEIPNHDLIRQKFGAFLTKVIYLFKSRVTI